jgi:hypothetical protein
MEKKGILPKERWRPKKSPIDLVEVSNRLNVSLINPNPAVGFFKNIRSWQMALKIKEF